MRYSTTLVLLLSLVTGFARGQSPEVSPETIVSLQETKETQYGRVAQVALQDNEANKLVIDQGVTSVLVCETVEKPRNAHGFSIRIPVNRPIGKDEVLLVRFYARTIYARTESGLGVVQPCFEKNAPPYTRSLSVDVEIGRDWKQYTIPFKAVESYEAGESAVSMNLGFQEQSIEIGDCTLFSYGVGYDMTTFPDTVPRYRGQEADAPWRKVAEQRIEQIRKGDLQIRIVNADNRPVANADVQVRMKRHTFGWGSAVVARRILQQDADHERYREIIGKYFNRVVFENDMKWYLWQNERNRENVFRAVRWLSDRNIDIRGHCLIWPSWRNTPRQLRILENDPQKLRETVREHIRDEASALQGSLIDWDVINEPYDNDDVMKVLGNEEMVEWFKLARTSDPNAKLFLNDYGILSGEGLDRRHQNHMFDTLQFLVDNDAPIDGIGFQGHFGRTATPPERLLEILDRFSVFKLPITITEHDINTSDEVLQAEFTRDFLTAMFSHPSVEAVLVWGFWERSHWRPNAAYYRADWSLKPAGKVWLDLVTKQWWSDFDEKTNADGCVSVRGFLGDYEIVAKSDNQTKTVETTISKSGTQIEITFD